MTAPGQGRGAPPLEPAAQETLAALRGTQRYPGAVVIPPEPPPMTEEERRLADEAAREDARICKYCVSVHRYPTSIGCPRIASAELDSEGQIRSVTFWPDRQWRKRIVPVEDLHEEAGDERR